MQISANVMSRGIAIIAEISDWLTNYASTTAFMEMSM